MPLTGDFSKLKKLKRAMADLGRKDGSAQREVGRQVVREVRGVLREQFAEGTGPYGTWERTKRGRPALVSRKLPQDFRGSTIPGGVKFTSRVTWLRAHHQGHTFPAQQVAAQSRFLTFDKRGRLIRRSRIFNKKTGQVRRGVSQTFAREHSIGARVLPRRPIYPDRGMSPRWAQRINAGAAIGMRNWHARALV
jgi:hypothetical protein